MNEQSNYFSLLNAINVNDKVEKKGNLSYLSWVYAWGELKKLHPDATYTVYENAEGLNYHTDGKTCWVKTGVTVNGIEHIEYLPVMDSRNKSISLSAVTSFDVNKAIQRSITKACARHGLGLYIYAGEDMPDTVETAPSSENSPASIMCEQCGHQILPAANMTAEQLAEYGLKKYGKKLCVKCGKEVRETLNRAGDEK